MIVEQTLSEKQQRTANILAAGNLWYGRKSAIALEKMSEAYAQSAQQIKITNAKLTNISNNINQLGQIAEEQLRIQKISAARQEQRYTEEDARRVKKENKEKEDAFRRDAFFHLNKELNDLETSNSSTLEKYFSLMSINSLITQHNISTSLTNDLNEKMIISDCLEKIQKLLKININNFTEQDNSDLNSILEIMAEDEEKEIKSLKEEKSKIKGVDKEINKIETSQNLYELVVQYKSYIEEIKDSSENLKEIKSENLKATSIDCNPKSIFKLQSELSITESLSHLENTLKKAKEYLQFAKIKIKEGSLTDNFDRITSAENYIEDSYSLIKSQSWSQVEEALKKSKTDAMVMIEDDAYEENFDDPLSYLKNKYNSPENFISFIIVDNFLYNAAYEFENMEWDHGVNPNKEKNDENNKRSIKTSQTPSSEEKNIILDAHSINGIVQYLAVLEDHSQIKENLDEAQQYITLAKSKIEDGSLIDEFDNIESSQRYINDAYSLIKVKDWDEIIPCLEKSQTDIMTMLVDDAANDGFVKVVDYLKKSHSDINACIFEIAVNNFLYNAGVEFENLNWK